MQSPSRAVRAFIIGAALACSSLAMAEPSLHQVYETANTGDLARAESMMREVITAHPESAKAHYVFSELLAKEGKIGDARNEFQKAESIQPGLPFAKPEAVNELKRKLGGGGAANHTSTGSASSPWTMWLGIGLLIAVAVFFFRALFKRRQYQPAYGPNGQPMAMNPAGYGPQGPYPQGGYGPQGYGPAGGGMGSGIMGGLATGAAVGAGIVAGEMLMHNILDDKPNHSGGYTPQDTPAQNINSDMGGSDFGVADNGSWDDGGSSFSDGGFGGGDSGDWS